MSQSQLQLQSGIAQSKDKSRWVFRICQFVGRLSKRISPKACRRSYVGILKTRMEMSTRFVPAMPALRNAYSKLVSLSSCTPMPFVRKSFFATRSNKTFARKSINYLCLGMIYSSKFYGVFTFLTWL